MAHLVLVDVHSGPCIAETVSVPVLVAHRGANDSRSVVFVAFFDSAGIGVVVMLMACPSPLTVFTLRTTMGWTLYKSDGGAAHLDEM